MEQRVLELNKQLQEKMRQRVKMSKKANNSNATAESNHTAASTTANAVQQSSSSTSGKIIEIRTPDDVMINSDYYSDSGVHVSSLAARSTRTSPSDNEV